MKCIAISSAILREKQWGLLLKRNSVVDYKAAFEQQDYEMN